MFFVGCARLFATVSESRLKASHLSYEISWWDWLCRSGRNQDRVNNDGWPVLSPLKSAYNSSGRHLFDV